MRHIQQWLTAIKSLGIFGVILLGNLAIITWSGFSVIALRSPLSLVYQHVEKHDLLEQINYQVLEQKIQESYLVLSGGQSLYLGNLTTANQELDRLLAAYLDRPAAAMTSGELELLQRLRAEQAIYRANMQEIVNALAADQQDTVAALRAVTTAQSALMQEDLKSMHYLVQIELLQVREVTTQRVQQAVLAGVLGLLGLPLLVMWAFGRASQVTQPLLTLTNAVVAIEGPRHPEQLLAGLSEQRGALGELAQALDEMGRATGARRQAAAAEVAALHAQLQQERRRKIDAVRGARHTPPGGLQ